MTAALVAGTMAIASMPAQAASLIAGKNFSMEGSATLKEVVADQWVLDFLPDQFAGSGDGRARVGSTSKIAQSPMGKEFYLKDLNLTKSASNWSFVGSLPWFSVNNVSFTLEKFVMTTTSLGGYQALIEGFFQEDSAFMGDKIPTVSGYFGSSPELLSAEFPEFELDGTTFQANMKTARVPTPALLPGLIGLGASIVRKKRQAIAA
jgi:hypothetical protein